MNTTTFENLRKVHNKHDLYGFTNKKGEIVIPCVYEEIKYIYGPCLASAVRNDEFLFVDYKGKEYTTLEEFKAMADYREACMYQLTEEVENLGHFDIDASNEKLKNVWARTESKMQDMGFER